MSALSLAARYAFFAAISMGINIGSQRLAFVLYDGTYALYVAMFFGTLMGLAAKYVLDRRYIFYYSAKTRREDVTKFFIYSCMGVITTLMFWGTEILFQALFSFAAAKYVGAGVGLTVGYTSKYFLDRQFVFRQKVGQP